MIDRPFCTIALLLLTALPAQASPTIYRCEAAAGVVYQDTPCAEAGIRLAQTVRQPTQAERRAARAVAARDKAFVTRVESERATLQRQAASDRARKEAENTRRSQRCLDYQQRIDTAESRLSDEPQSRRRRARSERQIIDARARLFSECLGPR